MVDINLKLIESILIFVLLVLSTNWLKYRKILSENSKEMFTKFITDYTLPALIFLNLAKYSFEVSILKYAALIIIIEIITLIISIIITKILKFKSEQIGAIALLSSFSSSALLGFALIKMIFPNDPQVFTITIIASEFGVGIPLFSIGLFVAIYFGKNEAEKSYRALLSYLQSPIFISLILGVLVSLISFNNNTFIVKTIENFLKIISNPIELFTAIVIGLIIEPIQIKKIVIPILIVLSLKLLLQPILADYLMSLFNFELFSRPILLILSALPSASLAVIIAERYGCDGKLASNLLIASLISGIVILPSLYHLFFQ